MNKSKLHKITAVLFALLFWQIAAMILDRSFLLSSPIEVLKSLLELGLSGVFWTGMWKSVCKILLGFLSGAGVGIFLAGLSYRFKLFEIYISPYSLHTCGVICNHHTYMAWRRWTVLICMLFYGDAYILCQYIGRAEVCGCENDSDGEDI